MEHKFHLYLIIPMFQLFHALVYPVRDEDGIAYNGPLRSQRLLRFVLLQNNILSLKMVQPFALCFVLGESEAKLCQLPFTLQRHKLVIYFIF